MREVDKALEAWASNANTRRLWRADATLWTGGDEGDWLGWLDVAKNKAVPRRKYRCRNSPREMRAEKFTDVLLLGMGGSSLGPEVLARSLGSAPGYPDLHVLDSTDPSRCGVSNAASMQHTRCSSCRANRAPRSNRTCSWIFFRQRRRLPSAAPRPGISSPSPIRAATCKRRREQKGFRLHLFRRSKRRRTLFRAFQFRHGGAGGDRA